MHLPIRHRVYANESPGFLNEARNYGRVRRGSKARRVRQKLTLHVYVKEHEVVHQELSALNATDAEILRVVRTVAGKWISGDTLVWDQLGRGGRTRNPRSQHYYNAEAI